MAAQPGHNSGDLNDNDRRNLFFVDRRFFLKAMEAKKAADAEVKRVGKMIKADLGEHGLLQIKAYEKAQTAEGKAELQGKQEAERQAMAWAGVPINTQLDIFTDRMPVIERAARDGEEAGLRGDTLDNPFATESPEGQAFAEAWHRGQGVLFAGIKKKEEEAVAPPPTSEDLIKGDDPFRDEEAEAA